ncbi:MAG: transglycosylase SLT domain-containing protein [Bacteroidaceae bacterium]|nr:transglycosylase SLT domain-containing protein [Bacteroidaceae bacterium]
MCAILTGCLPGGRFEERIITPQGDTLLLKDSCYRQRPLSVREIKERGRIRLLTYYSPTTYFKYNNRHFGIQYLITSEFARGLDVDVAVDSCKDSTEVAARLLRFEGDIAVTHVPGRLKAATKELQDSIDKWYCDTIVSYIVQAQKLWLSDSGLTRHEYPPYIDLKRGEFSQYDSLFRKYAKYCNWDWKLLAAQCYQESTFDKQAMSYMGARGLMQIMPHIAERINLPFTEMFDPETNIKAAVRLIVELNDNFSFIRNTYERQNFILAAYNGGIGHVMDAIALAKADTVPTHRWDYVAPYVLLLSTPEGYSHPLVQHGYMRGTETVGYVSGIRRRYAQYGGANRLTGKPYKTPTITLKKEDEEKTIRKVEDVKKAQEINPNSSLENGLY